VLHQLKEAFPNCVLLDGETPVRACTVCTNKAAREATVPAALPRVISVLTDAGPVLSDAAAALADEGPLVLDPGVMLEFDPATHPFGGKTVTMVLAYLAVAQPRTVVLYDSLRLEWQKRQLLHSMGQAIALGMRLSLERDAEGRETYAARNKAVLEQEIKSMMREALKEFQILEEGAVERFFAFVEHNCPHTVTMLKTFAVSPSTRQNTIRTPEWKLQHSFFALCSLLKTRSQEFSGLALLYTIYFFSLGVSESANTDCSLWFTVSSETMRA
jgi:hypothetical protein